MLATVQRVSEAEVIVEDKSYTSIADGLLVFICIERYDSSKTLNEMIDKILNFRMLDGSMGITSRSIKESDEEVLIISQFTLAAITNKGSKPSFHKASKPGEAKLLYDEFVNRFSKSYSRVKQGKFGALIQIKLVNKGPVTFNFKT